MNPTKLLIAQRLAEHAREGRAIVSLMEPFADDPRWAGVASDMAVASAVGDEMLPGPKWLRAGIVGLILAAAFVARFMAAREDD